MVRAALLILIAAILWLLATITPSLNDLSFAWAMALLGTGMGLLASQLGNIVQSSVGESERSEVGGLQYTAQNLGSSLGTALIGSLLIGALVHVFTTRIEDNPEISNAARQQVGITIEAGVSFVGTDQVRAAAERTGLAKPEADALVAEYAEAQLGSLKGAVLATAGIALASFPSTRHLPTDRLSRPSAA